MLSRLRWQLTTMYFLIALGMVILLGGGAYFRLKLSLQASIDDALQVKMAQQFQQAGLPVPDELSRAEKLWLGNQSRSPTPAARITNSAAGVNADATDEVEADSGVPSDSERGDEADEPYENELSPVFTARLESGGQNASGAKLAPVVTDLQAFEAAHTQGSDLRTTHLPDGRRVRLLTYSATTPTGPVILQTGRILEDQERILDRFLVSLLALGGICGLLLGAGSWLLSGRSLLPAQHAWDQQQVFISNASHELRTPLSF